MEKIHTRVTNLLIEMEQIHTPIFISQILYNNKKALSHQVGSNTCINSRHNVLSRTMLISKSLISRSFLITSLIVPICLPLPQIICLLSIWFTLLTTQSTSLLSTFLNHLSLFSTIFNTISATSTLFLILFVYNFIMSSLITHPP